MNVRFAHRHAIRLAAVTTLLSIGCAREICACSWISGALAYGTVTSLADGTPVAGASVRFTIYDGGQVGSLCAGGRYPRMADGEAMTDAAGRFRQPLRISNATPRAACVVATASPPEGLSTLRPASAAGGPVRFQVCGAMPCDGDSAAVALALPPTTDQASPPRS